MAKNKILSDIEQREMFDSVKKLFEEEYISKDKPISIDYVNNIKTFCVPKLKICFCGSYIIIFLDDMEYRTIYINDYTTKEAIEYAITSIFDKWYPLSKINKKDITFRDFFKNTISIKNVI